MTILDYSTRLKIRYRRREGGGEGGREGEKGHTRIISVPMAEPAHFHNPSSSIVSSTRSFFSATGTVTGKRS